MALPPGNAMPVAGRVWWRKCSTPGGD